MMPAVFLLCSLVPESQTISIGNKIPESIFKHVINYPSPILKISDFRGKIIIIDFWNHSCTACIQSFSKLDSLQKIFAGKIQIILVNRESKDSTERFFKKRTKVKMPNLPMITGDKTLINLFPIDGYPYTVWIDRNGIVKHFSGEYNVTTAHIRDFLEGKELHLRDVTLNKPGSLTGQKEFGYFSAITNCSDVIDVGNSELGYTDNKKSVRMSNTCSSIVELYKKAYREYSLFNIYTNYGLILEVKDSTKYFYPSDPNLLDEWLKTNSYDYELILPISKAGKRYKIMQEDLSRYFDLDASIERRKIKSVIIKNCNDKKEHTADPISGGSQSFDMFVRLLKSRFEYYYPVFDETTGFENKNIFVSEKSIYIQKIDNLQKELLNNDLFLDFEEREVPVLVIKERAN